MTATWSEQIEWVQLDMDGRRTGAWFFGSHGELVDRLGEGLTNGRISTDDTLVYVQESDNVGLQFATRCVTLTGPQDRQIWIPRPAALTDRL